MSPLRASIPATYAAATYAAAACAAAGVATRRFLMGSSEAEAVCGRQISDNSTIMDAATVAHSFVMLMQRTSTSSRRKRPHTASHSAAHDQRRFGAGYFRKYYRNPATRVTTAAEMHARAALIVAILRQAQVPIRTILDAGCGIGLLRAPFAALLPRARYTGLEYSEYLCARHGWLQGSLCDYAARKPSDLLVCYDVLQYLSDAQAARAIANMARLSRAALYVSALTVEDWRDNCDRSRTDRAVYLRNGAWYRRRLARHFRHLGFGLWLRKDVTCILWDMERH